MVGTRHRCENDMIRTFEGADDIPVIEDKPDIIVSTCAHIFRSLRSLTIFASLQPGTKFSNLLCKGNIQYLQACSSPSSTSGSVL